MIDVVSWLNRTLRTPQMVGREDALPGRESPVLDPIPTHEVLGLPLDEVPEGCQVGYFALGCYWGAEKLFWRLDGVVNTAAGFMGGFTPNPTYAETCTGMTGHTETVRVVYDPARIGYAELLRVFWEHHDPTQVDRQGNDVGTQYRSAIFTTGEEQADLARTTRDLFQATLVMAGRGEIATQIEPAGPFYYAEAGHQQYLDKHPDGYDCHVRTGLACPIPTGGAEAR